MEPFKLSLNQVNFDEQTFCETDHQLHSFSNLVSYDSDFKEETSQGFPVLSKRVENYPVSDSFYYSQDQKMSYNMDSTTHIPIQLDLGLVNEEKETLNEFSKNMSEADTTSDSFKAFTETVEALALQRSVIGSKKVTPASADEVARVIAATRERFSRFQSNDLTDAVDKLPSQYTGSEVHISKDNRTAVTTLGMEHVTVTTDHMTTSMEQLTKASQSPTAGGFQLETESFKTTSSSKVQTKETEKLSHLSDSSFLQDAHSMNSAPAPTTQALPEIDIDQMTTRYSTDNNHSEAVATGVAFGDKQNLDGFGIASSKLTAEETKTMMSVDSTQRALDGKELIRVPAKDISTAKTKSSSSWFWSKPTVETTSSPKHTKAEEKTARKVNSDETSKKALSQSDAASQESHLQEIKSNASGKEIREQSSLADLVSKNSPPGSLDGHPGSPGAVGTSSAPGTPGVFATSPTLGITGTSGSAEDSRVASVETRQSQTTHISTDSEIIHLDSSSSSPLSPSTIYEELKRQSSGTTKDGSHSSVKQEMSSNQTRQDVVKVDGDVTDTSQSHKITQMSIDKRTELVRKQTTEHVYVNIVRNESQATTSQRIGSEEKTSIADRDYVNLPPVDDSDLRQRLNQVLREKAKLEGQLEVLESESHEMLRERAELQTKVGALTQELRSYEKSHQGLSGDRDALSADLETLRQNRARLEAVIMDAHKLLEDKDEELKAFEHDLELSKEMNEKTIEQLNNSQREIKSRETTVSDLKTKITELYVDFQTTNQNRILSENEVGSLQGELKSMSAAKEWYKDQLQLGQKEKAELQSDVTRVKSDMIKQSTSIERLKAENVRMQRLVTETEQRSLSEKQTLARHLESIEADMMEREAAYAQMQRERINAVPLLGNDQNDNETTIALQEDLSKASCDLKRSQGQVALLQQEQAELMKRLALSQESILDRDKTIETLERNVVDVESQEKQTQLQLLMRNEEIQRLQHDHSVLQMELKSAKDEKEVFDLSLRALKDDMSVVEKSFRLMKQELLTKQDELDQLRTDIAKRPIRTEDKTEVSEANRLYEIPRGLEFSQPTGIVRSLTKYQTSETQTDGKPDSPASPVTKEPVAKESVDSVLLERLKSEKLSLETQLKTTQETIVNLDCEKNRLTEGLSSSEREVIVLNERSEHLELRLQQLIEEKAGMERRLANDKDRIDGEIEKKKEEDEEDLTKLQTENIDLKSKLGDLQRESHKEIAKQKTKALMLGKQLEATLKEHHEKCQSYEERIEELTNKVSLLTETNVKIETELANAQKRSALDQDERTTHLQSEVQNLSQEVQNYKESKSTLEVELNQLIIETRIEVEEYKLKIIHFETELSNARNYIEERRLADEETTRLVLELEREKGRLVGFIRSHATLKEHASSLEASLASKASSVVEMSSQVEESIQMKDRQIGELMEEIQLIKDSLAKEQQNVKDTRKQLMTEKGNHIKVRRELEQLSVNHGQLIVEVELLRKELEKITSETEVGKTGQTSQKMETERMTTEMKTIKLERDRLSRELEGREARDSALQEQIQSLEWKLSQKTSEMEALEEKASLVDETRQAETSGLAQSLQTTISELNGLRDELAEVKNERSEMKSKFTQLRQVLVSIVEQCNKATEAGKSITLQMIINPDELKRLLEETSTASIQSKPLSFLQATLSGLRGEINSLQKQVNEHTTVVQTSSQAWRNLEAQVEDLRQVCKSSAANRAASDKLSKDTEQLPSLSDLHRALQLPSTGPIVLHGSKVNIVTTASSKTTMSSSTMQIDINESKAKTS